MASSSSKKPRESSDCAAIVWFRRDLRLADNPALRAAIDAGGPVVCVFVHSPDEEGEWAPGGASRWWLHHALEALADELEKIGSRLIVRTGDSLDELRALVRETGATAVYWNRLYDPATLERDKRVKAALRTDGLTVQSHNAALLHEPWTIRNKSGEPFKVFTPFWRACTSEAEPPVPEPRPRKLAAPFKWPRSVPIGELGLLPDRDWADRFPQRWTPGERGAREKLRRFLNEAAGGYKDRRDFPADFATSRLSPHLHWGEIGPRQIWHEAHAAQDDGAHAKSVEKFLAEVGWREFATHLLFHFPETATRPLRPEFERFPWRRSDKDLRAWQRGRTGYPIVDAGMRELWATGWMHNRVRMIAASFLVKHLRIHWLEGARWFWDTLVDADLASNTLGWQWTAGCGADAAPYFRVFNPILQGQKFDAKGSYVRTWIPELADVPEKWIHTPWEAASPGASATGTLLDKPYSKPIVDHREGRERALEAFESIKAKA